MINANPCIKTMGPWFALNMASEGGRDNVVKLNAELLKNFFSANCYSKTKLNHLAKHYCYFSIILTKLLRKHFLRLLLSAQHLFADLISKYSLSAHSFSALFKDCYNVASIGPSDPDWSKPESKSASNFKKGGKYSWTKGPGKCRQSEILLGLF